MAAWRAFNMAGGWGAEARRGHQAQAAFAFKAIALGFGLREKRCFRWKFSGTFFTVVRFRPFAIVAGDPSDAGFTHIRGAPTAVGPSILAYP
ncbi:hypothetical protein [Rhizobium wuzhouense]|uniref:hypothetical protein n=1 Tax=Rhizobium wuzhouense TaxID=1986026 RepID=UPI0010582746|nr:hypothetical protein [Rhizobium wuzhouense]